MHSWESSRNTENLSTVNKTGSSIIEDSMRQVEGKIEEDPDEDANPAVTPDFDERQQRLITRGMSDEPTFNPAAIGLGSRSESSTEELDTSRRHTQSLGIRNEHRITKEQLMKVKMQLPKKIVTPTANPYMCGYFLKTVRN